MSHTLVSSHSDRLPSPSIGATAPIRRRRSVETLCFLLFLLTFSSDALAQKRVALIVGCVGVKEDFEKGKIMSIDQDASKLRMILEAANYEVHLLTESEAKVAQDKQKEPRFENVSQQMKAILNDPGITPDSRIILSFSGQCWALRKKGEKGNGTFFDPAGKPLSPSIFLAHSDSIAPSRNPNNGA